MNDGQKMCTLQMRTQQERQKQGVPTQKSEEMRGLQVMNTGKK